MRSAPSVLHVDMDSFFAAVEQRDKPSLRGKPVVVGGTGGRGVVATASYEARAFGIRSAMSTAEARARCPNAAFLAGRFPAYKAASGVVMDLLRELSPLVEPVSVDEAYVDLAAAAGTDLSVAAVRDLGAGLKARIRAATGLTASVGAGSSKTIAKIASDARKPDGLLVVDPGSELALLDPLPIRALSGVGPATEARLRALGVQTVAELRRVDEADLAALVGQAHGRWLWRLARADDDRPVVADRDAKSVSSEDTFAHDIADRAALDGPLRRLAAKTAARLRAAGVAGRTVTLKARTHDFRSLSRSVTLAGATDDEDEIVAAARALLAGLDLEGGLRLLGVGVSGLTEFSQPALFAGPQEPVPVPGADEPAEPLLAGAGGIGTGWNPGQDVRHAVLGPGWVQGSGTGRVTVRFETPADSAPGPVRTFAVDDPDLAAAAPPLWPPSAQDRA